MTEADFIGKIEWEGGVLAALEYGLTEDDLEQKDTALYKSWRALRSAYQSLLPLLRDVEKALESYDDDEEHKDD